tara:strand:- start:2312 stop:3328 length:1017 start_codon:yes stop_codon:yes gene_type:complete
MKEKKFDYSKLKYNGIVDFKLFGNLSVFEKKQFLIDNKLFFAKNEKYSKCKNSYYLENIAFFGLEIFHQKKIYQLNKDIRNEYLDYFIMSFDELIHSYHNGDPVSKYKSEKEKKLTTNGKIKYLKKLYKNTIKPIKSEEELDFLQISDDNDAFNKIKKIIIHNQPQDILDYLLGICFPENGTTSFDYCANLWIVRKILSYCTENIKSLTNSDINSKKNLPSKNKSTIQKEIEKPSKYPLVFKTLKSEEIFKRFLLETNAIDSKHNPINRKFKPLCHAFFNVSSETEFKENNIFKYNCQKKDFIAMLNKEFKTKFDKLSSGGKHEDKAQEYYRIKSNFV